MVKILVFFVSCLPVIIFSMEEIQVIGPLGCPYVPKYATNVPAFWESPKKEIPKLSAIILDRLVTFLVEKDDGTVLQQLEALNTNPCYNDCKKHFIEKYFIYLAAAYCDEANIVKLNQPSNELYDGTCCDEISGIAFTPTGSHILSVSSKAYLWNISDYQHTEPTYTILEGDLTPGMTGVHLSEDGLMAFAATEGKLYCWDSRSGKLMRTINLPLLEGHYPFVGAVFNNEGTLLAVSSENQKIWLYNLFDTLKKVQESTQEALEPELAIQQATFLARVYRERTGTVGYQLDTRVNTRWKSGILHMHFTADNTHLAAGGITDMSFFDEGLFFIKDMKSDQLMACADTRHLLLRTYRHLYIYDTEKNNTFKLITFLDKVNDKRNYDIVGIALSRQAHVIALAVHPRTSNSISLYLLDCKRKLLVLLCSNGAALKCGSWGALLTFAPDGTTLIFSAHCYYIRPYRIGRLPDTELDTKIKLSLLPIFGNAADLSLSDLIKAIKVQICLAHTISS